MKTNDFWVQPLNQLLEEIQTYISTNPGPHVAAFDADGTCWFNDVGRDFFMHQCDNIYKDIYTWQDYLNRELEDIEEALWWLAEVNNGRHTEDVVQEAAEALEQRNKIEFIPHTEILIQKLIEWGVEVYVVTASFKYAVIPATRMLGIKDENVLGVTTITDEKGHLGEDRFHPLTWTHGKAHALLEDTKGVHPFLCGGNSISDLKLLEASTQFKMGIRSAEVSEALSAKETLLMEKCLEEGWYHFDYL